MVKNQTKVRIQQSKKGQYIMTIPEKIAEEWLNIKKGDRVEFRWTKGIIGLFKVDG